MSPEGKEQQLCDSFAKAVGLTVHRLTAPAGKHRAHARLPGLPDRLYVGGEVHLWMEVKVPTRRLTEPQFTFLMACTNAGVLALAGGLPALRTVVGLPASGRLWACKEVLLAYKARGFEAS